MYLHKNFFFGDDIWFWSISNHIYVSNICFVIYVYLYSNTLHRDEFKCLRQIKHDTKTQGFIIDVGSFSKYIVIVPNLLLRTKLLITDVIWSAKDSLMLRFLMWPSYHSFKDRLYFIIRYLIMLRLDESQKHMGNGCSSHFKI